MSEENKQPRKDFNKFWPKITDLEIAKYAAAQGVWACGIICGFTVLNTVMFMIDYPGQPVDLLPLVDVALFGLIGIGIHKKYNIAAIVGLVLYLYIFISKITDVPIQTLISGFFAIFFILAFINAIRGTHKWHELKQNEGPST